MKFAFKYGLLITIGVIAWILVVHTLVPDPNARVHSIGAAMFFNALEVLGIYLGIRERQRIEGNVLSFKTAVKTGIGIAFVYGLLASAFFTFVVLFVPQWMPTRPGVTAKQTGANIAGAFAGLFIGALVMGVIYSTIISFLVVRMQKGRSYS